MNPLGQTLISPMIIASVHADATNRLHGAGGNKGPGLRQTQAPQRSFSTPLPSDRRPRYDSGSSVSEPFSPTLRLQQIAHQRIQYPAFRESFFFDAMVNPVLKGEGGDPGPISTGGAARKLWSSNGRSISSRLPKTAEPPGSAFRNECISPDQLYSSSRGSLGYEVTRTCANTARITA